MLKKVAVVMGILAVIAAPAMATTVHDPWSASNTHDELNLYEIVNALYGTHFASTLGMQYAQIDPNDEIFAGKQDIEAEARYASWVETLGWYQPTGTGHPLQLHTLFTVTTSGLGSLGSAIIDPTGTYGFFDQAGPANNPNEVRWFSETNRNSNREDHMVAYDLEALTHDSAYHDFLLTGWEDKPFSSSDRDYQDLVVQLGPVGSGGGGQGSSTPEPATLVLLGLGAGAAFLRRKFYV